MEWDWSLWIRLANSLLSGLVAGLCFLKLENTNPDKARNARIAGLGILCTALAWGFFAQRDQPFNIRLPMYTLGLIFSYYGMRRMAIGEKPQYKK